MRYFRVEFVVALLVMFSSANGTGLDMFHNSYALVVGIDTYPSSDWPSLEYARSDAVSVAEYLARQGFDVKTFLDEEATRENIVNYLENEIAQFIGSNDRFVFFFAGHGHTEYFSEGRTRGYIVPYDGGSTSSTYLSMSRLRDISDILGIARHQLFVMDSCYGGRLGSRGQRNALDPRIPEYIDEITKRKARQILTAGGATQQVQDVGPDGHSVFTGELLKALDQGFGDTNGDGFISFYELSGYVLRAASRPNQTPGVDYLDGHGQGEFVFVNPVHTQSSQESQWSPGLPHSATRGTRVVEIVKEGKRHFLDNKVERARELFEEAASLGNIEAEFFLGTILYKSYGEEAEGLRLVTNSAESGHVPAMKSLYKYYSESMTGNPERAAYWKSQIDVAEALAMLVSLTDPTDGQASQGDPDVPDDKLDLGPPGVPMNVRLSQ